MPKYAILSHSAFNYIKNKTGNMLIRYRPDEVTCVIDSHTAGQTVQDALGFGGDIPVVSSFKEAEEFYPDRLVIGSVMQGGFINEDYRREIIAAIQYGCDIYNGMHEFMNDDPEFVTYAEQYKVMLHDLRCPPSPPHFPKKTWQNRKTPVLLIVGTDCDTGKMTTGWEIKVHLEERGWDVSFIGTGQTGILLSGSGVPVDAVVGDFIAGEIEFVIDQASDGADILIVEGQGSLTNMLYSGVTLGLMHGAMPDYMIMTHDPARKVDVADYPMSTISHVMKLHLDLMKDFRQSKFLGINLLSLQLDENSAKKEMVKLEKEFNMPVTDLVRFGNRGLIDKIEEELKG